MVNYLPRIGGSLDGPLAILSPRPRVRRRRALPVDPGPLAALGNRHRHHPLLHRSPAANREKIHVHQSPDLCVMSSSQVQIESWRCVCTLPALWRRKGGRRRGVVPLTPRRGRVGVGGRLVVDGVRPRRLRAGAAVPVLARHRYPRPSGVYTGKNGRRSNQINLA